MQTTLITEIAAAPARPAAPPEAVAENADGFSDVLEATPPKHRAASTDDTGQGARDAGEAPCANDGTIDLAALLGLTPPPRDMPEGTDVSPSLPGPIAKAAIRPEATALLPAENVATGETQSADGADAPDKAGELPQAVASPEDWPAIEQGPYEGRSAPRSDAPMADLQSRDSRARESNALAASQPDKPATQPQTPPLGAAEGLAADAGAHDGVEQQADAEPSDAGGQAKASEVKVSEQPPPLALASNDTASGQGEGDAAGDQAPADPESAILEAGRADPRSEDTRQAQQARPEILRQVAQPLFEAIRHDRQGRIELSLRPEELGHVRFSFTPSDGGIAVAISSDRSDTLDLLRRHIGMLQDEFRQLGYGDISFDFRDGSQQQAAGHGRWAETEGQGQTPQDIGYSRHERPAAVGASGLDLRL